MKAKLTKVVAMASLAAFLTVGIGANVAQAKDFRFTIGDSPRMEKNADGTVDSSDHPWFKKGEKKHKKRKLSEREKHDKNKIAERSHKSMRSESSND